MIASPPSSTTPVVTPGLLTASPVVGMARYVKGLHPLNSFWRHHLFSTPIRPITFALPVIVILDPPVSVTGATGRASHCCATTKGDDW